MSVVAAREILPRTYQHRLGESPTASRVWNLTVTDHVPATAAMAAVGAFLGGTHPDYGTLRLVDVNVEEVDRFHVQVSASYGIPENETDFVTDKWSFSTGGSEVPALTYYEGSGNTNLLPLVNAVGDYFEGLTTKEAEVKATISWQRPFFPAALAAAVTNSINDAAFGFGAKHTWLCAGISAQMVTETQNGLPVVYWTGSSELIYRASGWNLLLPHVGFNVADEGEKVRAWVEFKDEDGGVQRLPAANAIALNEDGTRRDPSLSPLILSRRVYREINFSQYFATPPSAA